MKDKFSQEQGCICPLSDNGEREEGFSLECCRTLWEGYFLEKKSVEKEMLLLAMLRAASFEKLCQNEANNKKK